MSSTIPGLHHVTAISGPPQVNVDFYVETMRQRLVKRTVNFDFPFADAGPGRAAD
jgi:glyoxalase family protein